jgi:iron complex outermembrane receptor protein
MQLRRAPAGKALSIEAGSRAYSGPFAEIIGSIGSSDGKAGLVAGVNLSPAQEYVNGAGGDYVGGGFVGRWSPAGNVNLTAFGTATDWVADPDTGFAPTGGEFIPARIRRGVYRGQRWARFDNRQQTAGLIAGVDLGSGWKASGGGFHSASQQDRTDFHLLQLQNREGDYRSLTIVAPRRSASAQSGSLLLERSWASGALRHRLVATARYRETDNVNSPSLAFDTGAGNIHGDYPEVEEPEFTIGSSRFLDRVRQSTGGVGYRVSIGSAVELRADVQKTDYSKTRVDVSGETTRGGSKPWLYSGSVLWAVTRDTTLFGSYSRGLEESGVAPNSAVNRGEVLPAVIATQRELGVRYALASSLSLIAGLFDTRKDTPGIGPDDRYRLIGEVRHRGIEASLAGALTPRLNVVAGVMLLDARVRGDLVEAGAIGKHAVGRPSRVALLNLSWRPKLVDNLSVDGTINHEGPRYIGPANLVRSEALTTVDLGLRYGFKLGRQPLSLRPRVVNLFDAFAWRPDSTGTLYPSQQRGFHLSLRGDF